MNKGWKVKPCGNPEGYFTAYYQISDMLGTIIHDVDIWHFPERSQAVEFGRLENTGMTYEDAAQAATNN